jgi:DNA-binding MltR family transcriptional regulator
MAKVKHVRTLRVLTRSRGIIAVINELEDPAQTDRAVAIVGAAYVDVVLLEVIGSRLPRRDESVMKELFEDRGQLQPFGSRIQIGYLLNAYGPGVYQDLRAIKEIRNAFAHSAEAMDFTHADVARLANALNLPKKIQYKGHAEPTTPRERYVRAIELLADLLLHDMTLRAAGRRGEQILQMGGR